LGGGGSVGGGAGGKGAARVVFGLAWSIHQTWRRLASGANWPDTRAGPSRVLPSRSWHGDRCRGAQVEVTACAITLFGCASGTFPGHSATLLGRLRAGRTSEDQRPMRHCWGSSFPPGLRPISAVIPRGWAVRGLWHPGTQGGLVEGRASATHPLCSLWDDRASVSVARVVHVVPRLVSHRPSVLFSPTRSCTTPGHPGFPDGTEAA
jgi:hypothetical protein